MNKTFASTEEFIKHLSEKQFANHICKPIVKNFQVRYDDGNTILFSEDIVNIFNREWAENKDRIAKFSFYTHGCVVQYRNNGKFYYFHNWSDAPDDIFNYYVNVVKKTFSII